MCVKDFLQKRVECFLAHTQGAVKALTSPWESEDRALQVPKGQQPEERRPGASAAPASEDSGARPVRFKCGELLGGSPRQKIKAGKLT